MSTATGRRPAIGFIFVTLVLSVLGFSIIIPVLPKLVTEFEGNDTARGAQAFGWLLGAFGAMQFLASPVLGALSDRFGRRKVILLSLAGSAIDYVVMGFAPSLAWLFVARMISGVTSGVLATCNAYIADVTPPAERAHGFGLVGAAYGLGFVIGPALGGMLGNSNPRLPFFVAAGCVTLNLLYGFFVLPESLPPERRKAFSWRRANPVGALVHLKRAHRIGGFAAMHFLFMFGQTMAQSVWVLYTGHRFGWNSGQVGISLMMVGVSSALVQGLFIKPILTFTGEKWGLLGGLLLASGVMVLYGLATQGWMMYVLTLVGGLGGIAGPAAQGIVTRRVSPDEQGMVQGALTSLSSLASIFAPLVAAGSFAACIRPEARFHLPGIAFFEASVLLLVGWGIAVRALGSDHAMLRTKVLSG